jgi:hypothetical protein
MSTIRAMAVGGHADGRYVEFHGGSRQAIGRERLYTPDRLPEGPTGPMDTVTVRQTLYKLEEVRGPDGQSVYMAVPHVQSVFDAMRRLLAEHGRVG